MPSPPGKPGSTITASGVCSSRSSSASNPFAAASTSCPSRSRSAAHADRYRRSRSTSRILAIAHLLHLDTFKGGNTRAMEMPWTGKRSEPVVQDHAQDVVRVVLEVETEEDRLRRSRIVVRIAHVGLVEVAG